MDETSRWIILACIGAVGLAGCTKSETTETAPNSTPSPAPSATSDNNTGDVKELQKIDLVVGTGDVAETGNQVTVNYVGTLNNGMKFDSSYDHNEPFKFVLGGQVIAGWNQGVVGMKVGGKRRLIIPPSLGYRDQSVGPIPPNSTLHFDIELLAVSK